jgi:hypothetical protein
MKWMKFFEDFKMNNQEGDLITQDDVIKCIKEGGVIYSTIIIEYPDNDPEKPLKPISIDEDGLITIELDGNEHYVNLDDVEKIEF